ncbi:hypothetical protein R83H12_00451 [Fibrobacteria bacterium R8-3-H12]
MLANFAEFFVAMLQIWSGCHCRNFKRRANSSHNIFALGIHQKFSVEFVFAGGRVAGKGYSRAGIISQISKYHRLNIYCGSPFFGNFVFAAVENCAVVHPACKHGSYCSLKLLVRVAGEGFACFFQNKFFEFFNYGF